MSAPLLILRATVNIQCELGNRFVDLSEGGGANPPVILFEEHPGSNPNEIWRIYSLPGQYNTRVMIQSTANQGYLGISAFGEPIRCDKFDHPITVSEQYEWYLEGADVENLPEDVSIRFRSVQHPSVYIDLSGGNPTPRTPFITWSSNDGANQRFRLMHV